MKHMALFWKVFFFFFIVPFPMFLYYSINEIGPNRFGNLSNPYMALVVLGRSVVFCVSVLIFTFKNWKLGQPGSKGHFKRAAIWFVMLGAAVAYYVFSYRLESNGN